jgi:hypothetical protein
MAGPKMPTIGAGRYGFLGLGTKTGTASRIADEQLKRAQKDPTKLAPSETAKRAAVARKMEDTQADIQAQTEALAAASLSGTSVEAGALRETATGLGETLGESRAGISADVQAAGHQQQYAELERIKANAKEAEEARKATNKAILEGAGTALKVVGGLVNPVSPVVLAVSEISKGAAGAIKSGTTEEEEEVEEVT